MSSLAYAIPSTPSVLRHGMLFDMPTWLADGDFGSKRSRKGKAENWTIRREFTSDDALAASGDCFVTVATRLDKLAQGLAMDSAEQIEIEHIVRSLLYLQDHYAVVAKHKLKP